MADRQKVLIGIACLLVVTILVFTSGCADDKGEADCTELKGTCNADIDCCSSKLAGGGVASARCRAGSCCGTQNYGCVKDDDCCPSYKCNSGKCYSSTPSGLPNGASCTSADQCKSGKCGICSTTGSCVDAYCSLQGGSYACTHLNGGYYQTKSLSQTGCCVWSNICYDVKTDVGN